jgi:hypothetical protein
MNGTPHVMNGTPHVHRLRVEDKGSYWAIYYGDQASFPSKPTWWPWDSPERYDKTCAKALKRHVERIVRKHDRMSRFAGDVAVSLPSFVEDGTWGSDQLARR